MNSPTLTNLIALLADYACVPEDSIVFSEPLSAIGIDSLDHAKILVEIEDQFEIELPEEEALELTTVAALYAAIKKAEAAKHP